MTEKENALRFGPIPKSARHICVDMQRLFAEPTDWSTPWMGKVLPEVCALADAMAERTIFTRFISGRYQRRGARNLAALLPPLGVDDDRKAWPVDDRADSGAGAVRASCHGRRQDYLFALVSIGGCRPILERDGVDTVFISGGESDICVLATLLGAVDRGYRVISGHRRHLQFRRRDA